jgi:PDZ domain-containing protein
MNVPPPLFPPPPPPKRSRWRFVAVAVAIGVALGLLAAYVTVPYYTLGPGPAKDVSALVHVSGERVYPSAGNFFLTTVAVSTRPVSIFEAFIGWLDPAVSVVPRTTIVRPGLTDEQQSQYNSLDMEESKYAALIAALHATGFDTPAIPGARIIGVAAGFPAEGKLKKDDQIVAVNGVSVRDVESAVRPIVAKPIGSKVTVTVLRGDKRITAEMRTVASPLEGEEKHPVLGVRLAQAVKLPFDIAIDSENIGGPSAGLAFALTITDVLTPEDLTRGHHVAVTGTIDPSGRVGPVGGVEFKVRAAEKEGADVFLAPAMEVAEARKAASHLKVIGVSTLAEALAQLRKLAFLAPAAATG